MSCIDEHLFLYLFIYMNLTIRLLASNLYWRPLNICVWVERGRSHCLNVPCCEIPIDCHIVCCKSHAETLKIFFPFFVALNNLLSQHAKLANPSSHFTIQNPPYELNHNIVLVMCILRLYDLIIQLRLLVPKTF